MSQKVSIRFFNNREVRAAWDDSTNQWLFSIADIVGVLTESVNPRKYWSVLKNRLKKTHSELTTSCSQPENDRGRRQTLPDRLFHSAGYSCACRTYPQPVCSSVY